VNEEEKNKINYRFSGYQPPLIQLDGTGPGFWLSIGTHPYYHNQPPVWKRPAYSSQTFKSKSNKSKMFNMIENLSD
jgi:hypothetical protein